MCIVRIVGSQPRLVIEIELDQPGNEKEWLWSEHILWKVMQEPEAFSNTQSVSPNGAENQLIEP